jgi:hypothetical protein
MKNQTTGVLHNSRGDRAARSAAGPAEAPAVGGAADYAGVVPRQPDFGSCQGSVRGLRSVRVNVQKPASVIWLNANQIEVRSASVPADPQVAEAAAAAIGNIGGPAAAKVLRDALGKTRGPLRAAVAVAGLLCAESLLARGDRAGALALRHAEPARHPQAGSPGGIAFGICSGGPRPAVAPGLSGTASSGRALL